MISDEVAKRAIESVDKMKLDGFLEHCVSLSCSIKNRFE